MSLTLRNELLGQTAVLNNHVVTDPEAGDTHSRDGADPMFEADLYNRGIALHTGVSLDIEETVVLQRVSFNISHGDLDRNTKRYDDG